MKTLKRLGKKLWQIQIIFRPWIQRQVTPVHRDCSHINHILNSSVIYLKKILYDDLSSWNTRKWCLFYFKLFWWVHYEKWWTVTAFLSRIFLTAKCESLFTVNHLSISYKILSTSSSAFGLPSTFIFVDSLIPFCTSFWLHSVNFQTDDIILDEGLRFIKNKLSSRIGRRN